VADFQRLKTLDPLYGPFSPDEFLRQLLLQPEVQRLREVRLSNIDSLALPGGANISRYEHSVGTAILASLVAEWLRLPEVDRLALVCAALLHDVAITAFGHLLEEGFIYAGIAYDHESHLLDIFESGAEVGSQQAQLYRGRTAGFPRVIERAEFRRLGLTLRQVFSISRGEGALGQLIKGTVDLDNIDNVCRMAYHIGIPFNHDLPRRAARGFFLRGGRLSYWADYLPALEEWLVLRGHLYSLLTTSPADFSAKAMLVEAIRLALVGSAGDPPCMTALDWKFTDAELLRALQVYRPTSQILDRFMLGDFYQVLGLYWVDLGTGRFSFQNGELSHRLRSKLSRLLKTRRACEPEEFIFYAMPDKRSRVITNLDFRSQHDVDQPLSIRLGTNSTRQLVGAVTSRRDVDHSAAGGVIMQLLLDVNGGSGVTECDPNQYGFGWDTRPAGPQLPLL
jgi:uncharacterized protein